MTNITFSQVQKSFQEVVLDIPDFQADSGEIFSIVGGNGAGKSTFIKLLAGIFCRIRARFVSMAFLIAPRKSTRWSSLSWRAGRGCTVI